MNKQTKYCIAKFTKYIKESMGIKTPFSINVTKNRDEDLKTYAYYNPAENFIKIYVKNRGMADILRSIAHEIVHHHQKENDKLQFPVQDVGGDIENEANAKAGEFVKQFGYENPELAIFDKTFE